MNEQEIIDLIKRYQFGQSSQAEKEALESWYIRQVQNSNAEPSVEALKLIKLKVQAQLPLVYAKPVNRLPIWIGIAASLIVIFFIAYNINKPLNAPVQSVYSNDIPPGTSGGTLILGDGTKIPLASAINGNLATENGVIIKKTGKGQLVYQPSVNPNGKIAYNTLTTSRGEQLEVLLPDGSDVWLNAGSSLTFPASFSKAKFRKVVLSGEAYFEVSKNLALPFIVNTKDQEVRVLGTHFNINSYLNQTESKTTLLEGSVKVNNELTLVPGEQAIAVGKSLRKTKADTELAVAWKNNKFMFEDAKIEEVMGMIERWYDVEVIYQGERPSDLFGGSVSRFDHVSKVLRILELTGHVHFKVEGRRITVMK